MQSPVRLFCPACNRLLSKCVSSRVNVSSEKKAEGHEDDENPVLSTTLESGKLLNNPKSPNCYADDQCYSRKKVRPIRENYE